MDSGALVAPFAVATGGLFAGGRGRGGDGYRPARSFQLPGYLHHRGALAAK
jgi:hypothetical protein